MRTRVVLACLLGLASTGCSDAVTDDDATPSRWRAAPDMPGRRLEPGVAALGSTLVVLGGFDTTVAEGLRITDAIDVFDAGTEVWTRWTLPAPVRWSHVNLASSGGTLFLLGGLDGVDFVARGDAWALGLGASAWRALAPLPPGLERGAAGVVATPDHIYLLGGASSDAAVATCVGYDIARDAWSELPALPAARSHPAAMQTADGTLIVAAGLRTLDSTQPLGDVLALPPGATAWQARGGRLTRPRGGCAYGVVAGALVCAGGEAGEAALRAVDAYDPVRDAWDPLDALPVLRAGTQGAAIADRLYVPGGAPALAYLPTDTLYVYPR